MSDAKSIKPVACIRRHSGVSFCTRDVSDNEFMFTDGEYAVNFYDPRGNKIGPTQLSACEACCDVVQSRAKAAQAGGGFGGADLRGMVKR